MCITPVYLSTTVILGNSFKTILNSQNTYQCGQNVEFRAENSVELFGLGIEAHIFASAKARISRLRTLSQETETIVEASILVALL